MAEEVEITNFGEGGVASEETLRQLLKSFDDLGKKMGVDSTSAKARAQEAYNRSIKSGIEVVRSNRDSLGKNTEALDDGTSAVKRFTRSLSGLVSAGIGALLGTTVNLSKELLFGGNRLSDFTEHLPIMGSYFTMLASTLDDSIDMLNNLSGVGASFNNSIQDLRLAAARASMPLNMFGEIVRSNSQDLAALGGTVTRGANAFSGVIAGLRESELGSNLRNMGFTIEEISDGLLNYSLLQRRNGRLDRMSQAELRQGTHDYLKQIDRLRKLTGLEADQIQDAVRRNSLDAAMRAVAARSENAEGFMTGISALTERLGPEGARLASAFQELTTGTVQLDETQALMFATNGRAMDVMQEFARTGDFAQLQRNLATLLPQLQNFEQGLDPAVLSTLQNEGLAIADILGQSVVLQDIINQGAAEAAEDEQDQSNRTTRALREFRERISQARGTLFEAFLDNDFVLLPKLIERLNEFLSSENIELFAGYLADAVESLLGFIDRLTTDPMGTIEDTYDTISTSISNLFANNEMLRTVTASIREFWDSMSIDISDYIGIGNQAGETATSLYERFKIFVFGERNPRMGDTENLWERFKRFVGLESLTDKSTTLYNRLVEAVGFPERLNEADTIFARFKRFVFGDEETGQDSLYLRFTRFLGIAEGQISGDTLFQRMVSKIEELIFGKLVEVGPGRMFQERQGGILNAITNFIIGPNGILTRMTTALIDMFAHPAVQVAIDNAVTSLFNTLANSAQLMTAIKGLFGNVIDAMLEVIDNAFGGAGGSSLSSRNVSELSTRDLSELSLEERQDLIQTAREINRQRILQSEGGDTLLNQTGAILGNISDFASDAVGNLDARTMSDASFLALMQEAGIEGFNRGTGGFRDFGAGTLAILHGREAVIPENAFQDMESSMRSLDTSQILSYNSALQDLVPVLESVNAEIERNRQLYESQTPSADGQSDPLFASISRLNTTMDNIKIVLDKQLETQERTQKNTRGISGNLLNGGTTNRY